jgi:hypothetical protein
VQVAAAAPTAAGVPRVPSPPVPDLASRGTDSSPSGSWCPRPGPIADQGTSGCWVREPGPLVRHRRPARKRRRPARYPPIAEPAVSRALPSPSPKNGRPGASPLDVEPDLHHVTVVSDTCVRDGSPRRSRPDWASRTANTMSAAGKTTHHAKDATGARPECKPLPINGFATPPSPGARRSRTGPSATVLVTVKGFTP